MDSPIVSKALLDCYVNAYNEYHRICDSVDRGMFIQDSEKLIDYYYEEMLAVADYVSSRDYLIVFNGNKVSFEERKSGGA